MSETVTRTLSEIASMGQKAARGAGCSWGLAEEVGMAVRLLESHDLPGLTALARLLRGPRVCACSVSADAPDCGIIRMAGLSDALGLAGAAKLGCVAQPLLLVAPLLMCARRTGRSYRLTWPGAAIDCGPDGLCVESSQAHWPDAVDEARVVTLDTAVPGQAPDWRARAVPAADWQTLDTFAQRTLVPESAASRAGGAGPGSDTD